MLFEFRGKVYEVNSVVLIILGIFLSIIVLYLFYLLGSYALSKVNLNDISMSFGDDNNKPENGVSLSNTHKISNSEMNGGSFINDSALNHSISNKSKNNNPVDINPIPKEVIKILTKNPNANNDEICYFNGHGRIANYGRGVFDCRKTEDLKIITIKDRKVYCCVTP